MLRIHGDPGLDELRSQLGADAERPTQTYRMDIIDDPGHTFIPLWSQDELRARIRGFVADLSRRR